MGKVRIGKGFRERNTAPASPCRRPCLSLPFLAANVSHTPLVVPVIAHIVRERPILQTGTGRLTLTTVIGTLPDMQFFLLGITSPANGAARTLQFQILRPVACIGETRTDIRPLVVLLGVIVRHGFPPRKVTGQMVTVDNMKGTASAVPFAA